MCILQCIFVVWELQCDTDSDAEQQNPPHLIWNLLDMQLFFSEGVIRFAQ